MLSATWPCENHGAADAVGAVNAAASGGRGLISSSVYGPVPSRRLGRSLGINNIPPKICSYSCVYCQLGKTERRQIRRQALYEPHCLARSVRERAKQLREKGELIDYLAFVPDGEPTLDINLGKEIELLKTSGIKIAVITNASLIWYEDVRRDLQKADWVCLKVDAVTPDVWNRVNRPHRQLKLDIILDGLLHFARSFRGVLTTETMLIMGINDDSREVSKTADFLAHLKPAKAYLAVPTRPTAELVKPATDQMMNNAFRTFREKLKRVECLTGYEGNTFVSTGNVAEDLLSITAVHPMREDAVNELLHKSNEDWGVVRGLINNGRLLEIRYQGKKFYARKLAGRVSDSNNS